MEGPIYTFIASIVLIMMGILLSIIKKDKYGIITFSLYAVAVWITYYPLYFIVIVWLGFDSTLSQLIVVTIIAITWLLSIKGINKFLKKRGIRPKDEE